MKKKFNSAALLVAAIAALSLPFGCTKGMGLGGTDDAPAAVETAGVPPLPEAHGSAGSGGHGSAAEHGSTTAAHGQDAGHAVTTTDAHATPSTATTTAHTTTTTAPH